MIHNSTGFVKAEGRNIYDGDGYLLYLKGVNLGNWMNQEDYMTPSSVGTFETGIYTEKRGLAAMKANPNLTDEDIEELRALYIDNYITEKDFAEIAYLGFNCVRIVFQYMNFTLDDGVTLKEDPFAKINWALDMCEKYKLYAIMDLHGAKGSQNMDFHSGDDAEFDLYGNRANMDATVRLWEAIAENCKDRKIIAGYDLLNETRRAPNKYTGKAQFDFYDELYRAIRKIDGEHMIIMECFTFPTHGVKEKKYRWENVAYSYHFYNFSGFSYDVALYFYNALHNLKGYNVPIIVGEFNAWDDDRAWKKSLNFFAKNGWSVIMWCYKANRYRYDRLRGKKSVWGLRELNVKPVDLSTATKEEIEKAYNEIGSENAEKTSIYRFFVNKK